MSRATSRQRNPGRPVSFRAPLGRRVKFITGVSLIGLVIVVVAQQIVSTRSPSPLWMRVTIPVLIIGIFAVVGLFSVRGFEVKGRDLSIHRPLWSTHLSLEDLQAAHADAEAMKGAWRTAGNGGLFAFTGWFRSKRLGGFRAFVTDTARCVVLEFQDRKLVVSPDNPERFVEALGFSSNSNQHRR